MNAYTLEFSWSAEGRSGVTFVYAEGETLKLAKRNAGSHFKSREKLLSLQLVDAFAHATCDKLQPCKNGVL